MRYAILIISILVLSTTTVKAEGLMSIPGLDFVYNRVRNHGYAGRGWDLKGRPQATYFLNMNDNGPFYVGLGAYRDELEDKFYALGGLQFDALWVWEKARNTKPIKKMGLTKFPSDWKLMGGVLPNLFRVTPDNLRLDRDVIFNVAIQIPLGKGGE